MNRADVRETLKMHLSILDPTVARKFSDSFLNKLIEKEHRDVVTECRVLRTGSDTDITLTSTTALTTEQEEAITTELGDSILLDGFDAILDIDDLSNFYKLIDIRYDGHKAWHLKYENLHDPGDVGDYTDHLCYYFTGRYILFINGDGLTVNAYYYAKPEPIADDTQELELDVTFEDAIVYGVLKKISISTKGITYEIVDREHRLMIQKVKNYYRDKYLDKVGQVIPMDI